MDKKPLIGVGICAVVLLVLGSLSNVVGYNSVKSTVNDSPLFNIRTQRATNQQQNIITSQYLGKGNLWNIPMSDNRNEQLKKVIDIISKMDDKTFEWFIKSCIQKVRQDKTFSETNNEIIQMLQLLRKESKTKIFSIINKNNQECGGFSFWTFEGYTMCAWFPGCWILSILYLLLVSPILIIWGILDFFTLNSPRCETVVCIGGKSYEKEMFSDWNHSLVRWCDHSTNTQPQHCESTND